MKRNKFPRWERLLLELQKLRAQQQKSTKKTDKHNGKKT